jgi:hypothetical protein
MVVKMKNRYQGDTGDRMKNRVSSERIRQIIREELSNITEVGDDVSDAQERSTVIKVASDLMKSINAFKDKATESMQGHVEQNLTALYDLLRAMTDDPHAYTDKQAILNVPVKKSFKPADEKVIK